MDTDRTLLSCPGRVQDWLGAAAEQIETLLQVPMPSLSGSDQAIGALRIKRENPSWETCPYNLRSASAAPGLLPVVHQIPISVSSDRLLYVEKSPSRCENCVSEERSQCSREFPSCTRCRENGLFCCYMEGVPTSRRKPQGRRHERSRIREGEPGLPSEALLVASVSEDPVLPEIDEALAARNRRTEIPSLHASGYALPSLEYPTTSSVDLRTDVSPVEISTDPLRQTVAAKRQITMLPRTPTFSLLSHRKGKREAVLDIAGAELCSELPDAVASGLGPTSAALAAAEGALCQDSSWGVRRKILENALQKCVDDGIQRHGAHMAVLPLQAQSPPPRRTSAVSSLAATPLASTVGSRSTSRSSETDSLPITPGAELPIPLTRTNTIACPRISASQTSSVSHIVTSPSHKNSVTGAEDMEAPLSRVEELVGLYLLPHQGHHTAYDTAPTTDPQGKSFSEGFLEQLFEEGDAARRLVEFQRRLPEVREPSFRP